MTRFAPWILLAAPLSITSDFVSAADQESAEKAPSPALAKRLAAKIHADKKTGKPASAAQEETVRRLTEKVERVKAGAKSGRPTAAIPPKSSRPCKRNSSR